MAFLFVWTYWRNTVKLPRSLGLGNLWRIDVEQTSNYISENTDVDIIKWEGGGIIRETAAICRRAKLQTANSQVSASCGSDLTLSCTSTLACMINTTEWKI